MSIAPSDLENIAREFCRIRGINPEGTIKQGGTKMKNWELAAGQVMDTFSINQAIRTILQDKDPMPAAANVVKGVSYGRN